jgi:hypothetical protein
MPSPPQIRGFSDPSYQAGADPVATGWIFQRRIHGMRLTGGLRASATRSYSAARRAIDMIDDAHARR